MEGNRLCKNVNSLSTKSLRDNKTRNGGIGERSHSVSSLNSTSSIILKDDNSDSDVIEAIHTFNMKSQTSEFEDDLLEETPGSLLAASFEGAKIASTSEKLKSRRGSSTSQGRAIYVEENVQVQNGHLNKAGFLLKQASRMIKEFRSVNQKTLEQRDVMFKRMPALRRKLKISFSSESEIDDDLTKDERFKFTVRN